MNGVPLNPATAPFASCSGTPDDAENRSPATQSSAASAGANADKSRGLLCDLARLNDAIRAVNTKLFWDVSAGDPTSFGGVDCAKSAKQSQIIKEKS
jgi:hypothetical protein